MAKIVGWTVAFLLLATGQCFAVCPGTLELQDANGVKAAAKYTDDGSGNCMPNVVIGPGAASGIIGSLTPTSGVSVAQTAAATPTLVAKAAAGNVISVSGSAVTGSFIMLFDAVTPPVDGSVTPKKCFGPMVNAGPFVFAWGLGPVLTVSTGITIVSSSTGCFTKTGTNANFLSVEYQ